MNTCNDVNKRGEIVLYQTPDGASNIEVRLEDDTVWLNVEQLSLLFQRNRSTLQRHIKGIYDDGELDEGATCAKNAQVQQEGERFVERYIPYYNLDVIISLGYRVKSRSGVMFRIWASKVLKDYLLRGAAVNDTRLKQLGETVKILKRTTKMLDAQQVLSVVEQYAQALNLLDAYDHQSLEKPIGQQSIYVLTYEECRKIIDQMRFASESELFGNEKDGSFYSSIGAIYQTFGGKDLYPSVEEKAANLLYFITKNHSFSDGNKRIAATIFLYFLQKNGILHREGGENRIDNNTLVAITIMIAESTMEEKETMIKLVMNFLS